VAEWDGEGDVEVFVEPRVTESYIHLGKYELS
jgi:hypothetical protein